MMEVMNSFAQNFPAAANYKDDNNNHSRSLNRSALGQSTAGVRPDLSPDNSRNDIEGTLTTHVWPKSRMLFAVVSKMSKEGALNSAQRGVLKDLILESDARLLEHLQEYETGGNRDKLYYSFQ